MRTPPAHCARPCLESRVWRIHTLPAILSSFVLLVSSFSSLFAETPSQTPRMTTEKEAFAAGQHDKTIQYIHFGDDRSISLEGCHDMTIYCCEAHSIILTNCESVHIENCWIHDSKAPGIQVDQCKKVTIRGCRMENVASGVYALDSSGVEISGCFCRDVQGPLPRGQMVQFDNIKGAGNSVHDNYCINDAERSRPEDDINIYQSEGTPESPILIERNYLVGDPQKGMEGKSGTGSGIMLGDLGGANIVCRDNVVINAGQVGIGIAGGSHIRAEGNIVRGEKSNVSNAGMYAWNQSKKPGADISVLRNHVLWMDMHGEMNGFWDGKGFENLTVEGNDFNDEALASKLPHSPSQAPTPPKPATRVKNGKQVVEFPWSTGAPIH